MLRNLARMTTATTGTGSPITLGSAVTSYLSFADAGVQNGEEVSYAIVDGNNREACRGVYTASGTTLTRVTLESTNGGSPISLTGAAEVFITPVAEDINFEGFLALKTTGQSGLTSGADTQVTGWTESFDVGDKFASSAWTPSKGKVLIHADIYITDDGGPLTIAYIKIKKNGTAIATSIFRPPSSVTDINMHCTVIDDANGTDAYTVTIVGTTSSSTWQIRTDGGVGATRFMGCKL